MSSILKKEKKENKSAIKSAKKNPFGKQSKFNGNIKNVSKYSKEGREHMKIGQNLKTMTPNQKNSYFQDMQLIKKENPTIKQQDNPTIKQQDNLPKLKSTGIKLEKQKKILKREKNQDKKVRKEIRSILNNIIDKIE